MCHRRLFYRRKVRESEDREPGEGKEAGCRHAGRDKETACIYTHLELSLTPSCLHIYSDTEHTGNPIGLTLYPRVACRMTMLVLLDGAN